MRTGYKIAAAVFVGGRSTRMGSPKENMVTSDGKRTFLDRVCDEVDACMGECLSGRYLSVRKGQDIRREGYAAIEDEYDDIGPLGGLISVLRQAAGDRMDAVLIAAVDMTAYNKKEIRGICAAYAGEDILFARTEGRLLQPLASIYSVNILDRAVEQAEAGDFRLKALADELMWSGYYDSASPEAYINVNTPADLVRQ